VKHTPARLPTFSRCSPTTRDTHSPAFTATCTSGTSSSAPPPAGRRATHTSTAGAVPSRPVPTTVTFTTTVAAAMIDGRWAGEGGEVSEVMKNHHLEVCNGAMPRKTVAQKRSKWAY